MRELPILFSAPMVRAILEGRKTQTRRVVKGAPTGADSYVLGVHQGTWGIHEHVAALEAFRTRCPYGTPGDRLWVREAWKAHSTFNDLPPRDIPVGTRVFYLADPGYSPTAARYRHARFMPRWASRITLEVTGVRVERLQEISEADAIAEGLLRDKDGWRGAPDLPWFASPVAAYRSLWESINGPGSWDANPWVWVVESRRVEVPHG